MPDGGNGSFDGSQHFQCHDGRAKFLPIRILKKDNRFQNNGSPPPSRSVPPNNGSPPPSRPMPPNKTSSETSSATLLQFLEELRLPVETTSVLNQG